MYLYNLNQNLLDTHNISKSLNNSRKKKLNNLIKNIHFTHTSRSVLQKLSFTNLIIANKSLFNILLNLVAGRIVQVSSLIKLKRGWKEVEKITS